jgi:hypothetical protein
MAAQIETVQQMQDARRYAFLDHVLVHRLEGAADFAPSVPAELRSANLASFSNARDLRPYRGELAQDRIACKIVSLDCRRFALINPRTRRRSELFRALAEVGRGSAFKFGRNRRVFRGPRDKAQQARNRWPPATLLSLMPGGDPSPRPPAARREAPAGPTPAGAHGGCVSKFSSTRCGTSGRAPG